MKNKKFTNRLRADMILMLTEVQSTMFHKPDPARGEYCNGCGKSPYNVPQHAPGCIVPRLAALLNECKSFCDEMI